ncbi:hypothetical protein BHM03_00058523 [Ensete ventricosum]|nr:hypothetical protein BHM03_00058523 [Ensete ventricosum]
MIWHILVIQYILPRHLPKSYVDIVDSAHIKVSGRSIVSDHRSRGLGPSRITYLPRKASTIGEPAEEWKDLLVKREASPTEVDRTRAPDKGQATPNRRILGGCSSAEDRKSTPARGNHPGS